MANRRSKDKQPATNVGKQLVKHETASPVAVASCFTILGTILKPNYSIVLASSYDPYAVAIATHPIQTTLLRNPNASSYVKKQYCQNLFSIEPNKAMIANPLKFAQDYFPLNFHWILENTSKDLKYYSTVS